MLSDEESRNSSDDSLELDKNPTTIRLFGVNITIDQNEKTTARKNHSRKRKSTNPNQEQEEEEETLNRNSSDDSLKLDKNPKTIRLFGVNITIARDGKSRETQDIIAIDEKTTPQNPNQSEEEAPAAAPLPPPFHPRILEGIEQHPVLLFEKKLQYSDVARGQNRLLITQTDQLMAALTEEERGKVQINQQNKTDFVRVVTTDNRHGVEYTLHLKMWPASRAIVLKHQWSNLVAANGLKKGDSVQGWGYRVQDQEFRLALLIINKPN